MGRIVLRGRRWLRDKLYLWEYVLGDWGEKIDPDPKHFSKITDDIVTPVLRAGQPYSMIIESGGDNVR